MSPVGRKGAWSLVELVVVCLILVGLAAWLLPRYLATGKNSAVQKTVQAPMQRARGVECINNLRQIRTGITMAQQSEERFPANLRELRLPQEIMACPESKQAYFYDPNTGRVGCPYPPHQRF